MIYDFLYEKARPFYERGVSDESMTMTFGELFEYAEKFGRKLIKQPEKKLGILCRSELNTATAILSCFFAGKTAVPLSVRYGYRHTKKIIDSIGLGKIITDDGITAVSDTVSMSDDELGDVALIMCTSGTTGSPKGAMLTHNNLIANLNDISEYFHVSPGQRILISRPLYHCAVLTGEFLLSLIKGLDIVFDSKDFNPVRIAHRLDEGNISVMCGTPTIFYHICSLAGEKIHGKLSTIAVSGECMTENTAGVMRSVFPDADIYNVYGLTEASPRVSYLPPELFDEYPLSVGFPLSSVSAKINDGELLIKGASVMKGYYGNPEVTAKVKRSGWLHTGDIAEITDKGLIFIKTRKDNLIIRAGMNIYPQEIENALKSDPRIVEVLAYGEKRTTAGQKVCLKVVTNGLTKSEVFSICKKLLPAYQLPDRIDIVEDIPRNASGKIIRRVT